MLINHKKKKTNKNRIGIHNECLPNLKWHHLSEKILKIYCHKHKERSIINLLSKGVSHVSVQYPN